MPHRSHAGAWEQSGTLERGSNLNLTSYTVLTLERGNNPGLFFTPPVRPSAPLCFTLVRHPQEQVLNAGCHHIAKSVGEPYLSSNYWCPPFGNSPGGV